MSKGDGKKKKRKRNERAGTVVMDADIAVAPDTLDDDSDSDGSDAPVIVDEEGREAELKLQKAKKNNAWKPVDAGETCHLKKLGL